MRLWRGRCDCGVVDATGGRLCRCEGVGEEEGVHMGRGGII